MKTSCCNADFEILTRGYEVQCQTCGRRYTWEQYENIPPISAEIEEIISKAIHYETQADNFSGLSKARATHAITRLIQQAELRGLKDYSRHCSLLRMEPSTIGLKRWIDERQNKLTTSQEDNATEND